MFMVPCASSSDWFARFELLYEPGGCWTRRGGTETCAIGGRLLTPSATPSRGQVQFVSQMISRPASHGSDSASGAVEQVSVFGIESKSDRIGVSVILKTLHVQSNSIATRGSPVKQSQITQVFNHFNQ